MVEVIVLAKTTNIKIRFALWLNISRVMRYGALTQLKL
jgi:hypothetical protein